MDIEAHIYDNANQYATKGAVLAGKNQRQQLSPIQSSGRLPGPLDPTVNVMTCFNR